MKVLIVDDHPLARMGIKSILNDDKCNFEIEESGSIKESLEMIKISKPELMILDLKLGKEDGLSLVSDAKIANPRMKFIILSSYISKEDFLGAEAAGVHGYILKDTTIEDIKYIMNLVLKGNKYYDPRIVEYYKKNNDNTINKLTAREMEVLQELEKGQSNDEIAKKLFISTNTVKKHISNIMSKLNYKSRTQAVAFLKNTDK